MALSICCLQADPVKKSAPIPKGLHRVLSVGFRVRGWFWGVLRMEEPSTSSFVCGF